MSIGWGGGVSLEIANVDFNAGILDIYMSNYSGCSYCEDSNYTNNLIDWWESKEACEILGGSTWVSYDSIIEEECSAIPSLTGNGGWWFDGRVGGFQFELTNIEITDASGGTASGAGFTIMTEGTDVPSGISKVLAFTLTGTTIPPGEGILTQVSFSNFDGENICFGEDTGSAGNTAISDAYAEYVAADWGDCICGDSYPQDCAGVCGGSAIEDCAGVCDGSDVVDCAGVCDGSDVVDCAGVCGGDSVLSGCNNVCNSTAVEDCAGVCGGSAMEDCAGVCGGNATEDYCNACTSQIFDCVGVCDGSDVVDCAGVCGGNATEDYCNACTSQIFDCVGVCDGSDVVDCAGVCEGDNSSCNGCTNPYATNFDSEVTNDNGSCEYYAEGAIDEYEVYGIPIGMCIYDYIFSPVGEYIELFTALNYNIPMPILNFTNNTEEYQFSITFGITEFQCYDFTNSTHYMIPAINIIDYETGWSQALVGDINGDGTINVIDIVMAVDLILSNNYDVVGDVNEDGSLDVLDIVMLVDWVLNP